MNTLILAFTFVILPASASPTDTDTASVVVIRPQGEQMLYDTAEITARAGSRLTIVMENTATSPAMHHNVVVLNTTPDDEATIQAVGMAAMQAGEDAGYIPEHDAILVYTPMAAPGERTEVTFTMPPEGHYAFVCLFPGHFTTMRGVLRSTP